MHYKFGNMMSVHYFGYFEVIVHSITAENIGLLFLPVNWQLTLHAYDKIYLCTYILFI